MTTKSELSAANQDLIAEKRASLGEPPSAEEVLAYTRGELAPDEEARIRELLIAYPDLARTLTTPFPEGAEPGHPDYLSEHEFARHWKALRKRRQRPNGGLQFWRSFSVVAASVAVALGAMLWHAETELKKPQAVWEQQELFSDSHRGIEGEPNKLTPNGESYLLVPGLGTDLGADKLRVDILDMAANPPRTVWSSNAISRTSNGSLVILLRRDSLKPGTYKLVVYGITGARQDELSTFTLRVPAR
jgi:anti-sigma factor RsiW